MSTCPSKEAIHRWVIDFQLGRLPDWKVTKHLGECPDCDQERKLALQLLKQQASLWGGPECRNDSVRQEPLISRPGTRHLGIQRTTRWIGGLGIAAGIGIMATLLWWAPRSTRAESRYSNALAEISALVNREDFPAATEVAAKKLLPLVNASPSAADAVLTPSEELLIRTLYARLLKMSHRDPEAEVIAKSLEANVHTGWAARVIREPDADVPVPDSLYSEAYLFLSALTALNPQKGQEAVALLDRIPSTSPNYDGARILRTQLLARSGKPAEALADADRLLSVDSNWAWAWFARGEALQWLNRHDEAIASFDRAIGGSEGRFMYKALIYLTRADSLRRKNLLSAAETDLNWAMTCGSQRISAHATLGLGLIARDRYDYAKARQLMSSAIEQVGPDWPWEFPYRCRGVVNIIENEPRAAEDDLRRAIINRPHEPYARLLLWDLLKRTGKDDGEAEGVLCGAYAQEIITAKAWLVPVLDFYCKEPVQDVVGRASFNANSNVGTDNSLEETVVAQADRRLRLDALKAQLRIYAREDWQKCEATYYVGAKVFYEFGREESEAWFQECVTTGITYFNEYHLALPRRMSPDPGIVTAPTP